MIEVRLARASDLDWICELERANFSLPWTREQLGRQLSCNGHCLFAAELDGVPAGYMGLDWVLDEGYVTNVCTAPAFRRRGVAGELIDAVDCPRLRARARVRQPGGARVQRSSPGALCIERL